MPLFPAVVIGGPPDSGKSVLTANLTQALRERGVAHYVLRACPDGEGDWTYLAQQALVRTILVPQTWTSEFVDCVCRDLQRRHLPLIVDAGGRPQPWQEAIFEQCTHAILLTREEASRREWLDRATGHRLQLLADLDSRLQGESCIAQESPVLRGTLAGLRWSRPHARERQCPGFDESTTTRSAVHLQHPLFDALVERLAQLFAYDAQTLRRAHLDAAPAETVVDLERLARTLSVPHRGEQADWRPDGLPGVLDYLPQGVPLGLYGRGPNWLYAGLALLAHPAELWQFDVRLGWVLPAALELGAAEADARLRATVDESADCTLLTFDLPRAYLDYLEAGGLRVPPVEWDKGVILSGKLPHWLLTGLALAYWPAAWLAVYQPQVEGAVVVYSSSTGPAVGSVRACRPPYWD